ncbi:MAG: hypothetical protein KDK99_10655, partial [Verrucomicrobiales bacterium]|nr:hypothetical protein [Verrucomicrobiales bacterium]
MSQHTPAPAESRQSYLGMWIATLLLIVAFVFGLLMFPPLFSGLEDLPPAPDHLLFWGRFHPILVHLPVGILIFVIVLEMGCLRPAFEAKYGHAALLALWLGAAGACGAVIAGILLSREGGYSGAGFQLHQTMALIGTVGVLLGLLLRLIGMASENRTLVDIYRAVLIVAFSIMGIGAHFGANITHGRTFLTEFAPEGVAQKIHSMEVWMESFVEEKPEEKPAPAPQPTPAPTPNPLQPPPPPPPTPTPPPPPPQTPPAGAPPPPPPPHRAGAARRPPPPPPPTPPPNPTPP